MADSIKVTVDKREIERLGPQLYEAEQAGLLRILERGEQILRDEVPVQTHNLQQGISSALDPKSRPGALQGNLVVSASRGRTEARKGTVHLASGATKEVNLRAQPAHDYAEDVARGTGEFGPHATPVIPARAKALLIPVAGVPTLDGKPEAYVESDGQLFVFRRSMKGMKPNPYDKRAAERLEKEAQPIMDKALASFDQVTQ